MLKKVALADAAALKKMALADAAAIEPPAPQIEALPLAQEPGKGARKRHRLEKELAIDRGSGASDFLVGLAPRAVGAPPQREAAVGEDFFSRARARARARPPRSAGVGPAVVPPAVPLSHF
jgi:hypothetical protein